jgi:peroxiredoxin
MTLTLPPPLQPGNPAPDFTLTPVEGNRPVSLSDYRGRSPLLLALFPGFFCPFCRRSIVQLGSSSEKLKARGIESLAVVATDLENARLYYKYRPAKVPLAVDPERATHRSYGVPHVEITPDLIQTVAAVRINPTGELPEPMSIDQASAALDRLDGYQPTASDQRDGAQQTVQLKGQFLIDRDGLIRWANLECAREGPAGIGKFPTYEELLEATEQHALR